MKLKMAPRQKPPANCLSPGTFRWLALVAAVLAAGCLDEVPGPDDDLESGVPPAGLSVSEPIGGPEGGAALAAGSEGLVYVSAQPGTFPAAISVSVTNSATGQSLRTEIVDGGFDPVAIHGSPGDELEISVQNIDGTTVRYRSTVPERKRPRVVRTRPSKDAVDVALNASVMAVFSEPVDPGTITLETIALELDGVPVAATLTLDEDGLRAELAPDGSLEFETTYTLSITTQVRDLTGDPLEEGLVLTFTTVRPFSGGAFHAFELVTPMAGSDNSRLIFDQNGRYSLQSQWPEIGFFEHLGTYSVVGSEVRLAFDYTPCCAGREDWTAIATFQGDSLVIAHEWEPNFPYIEDGVYVRTEYTLPAADAGGRIAFVRDGDGFRDIYVANPDGSGLTPLTQGTEPTWSWDGGKIAFNRYDSDRDVWAIHVMDADGSNQVQLGDGGSPAWSPDGSQIAFAFGGGIWVMNADGSDRRELVNTASPGLPDSTVRIGRPTWSPDGQRIAFQACRCTLPVPFGYRQVMIMDADGTNVRPLSQDGWTTFSPAWSPVDADRIAVKSYDRMPSDSASFDHVIAFYSVSTGQREIRYRPHVRRLDYTHEAFDWSPGGRYIAFTQYNGYGGISRILYMDVETGDVRPLIPDDVDAFTPPDAEQYGVAWSRN